MAGSSNWVRYGAAFGLISSVVVLWFGYQAIFGSIGRVWTGFPIQENGTLGLRIIGTPESFSRLPPIASRWWLVEMEGEPTTSGTAAYARAATYPVGTPLTYAVVNRKGERREFVTPNQVFTQEVGFRIWLPVLGVGVLFLAMLSVPIFCRPDLGSTRSLFSAALGASTQYCFALPDLFLTHNLGALPGVFGWVAVAGALNLAMVFPVPRGPVREHPGRWRAGVWGATILLGVALHFWVGGDAARAVYADFLCVGLALLGVVGVVANLGTAALRTTDSALRRQARFILPGPLLFVGLATLNVLRSSLEPQTFAEPMVYFAPALIFSGLVGLGILRYDLFGFGGQARQTANRASLVLAAFSAFYFFFAVGEVFFDTAVSAGIAGATFGFVVITFVVWPRAFDLIEGFLEAVLLPEKQRTRLALEEAAAEIARLRDPASLAELLGVSIRDALSVRDVRFVVGSPDSTLREVGGRAEGVRIARQSALHAAVAAGRGLSTQVGSPQPVDLRLAVLEAREVGAALVVPMRPRPGFCGAVLCGVAEPPRPFTPADVALVEHLGASAGVAFENARAWEQVQDLRGRLERENHLLRAEVRRDLAMGEMIGMSAALRQAAAQIQQVAPTAASVLIVGETGSGKELAVRMLHRHSERSDRILVKVACAALPESLLESELFGHERGAFTGADQRRIGRFEVATGGTLFFDDVDTLPLGIQAKLLRALQEGEIQRLGSNELRHVDVRIIAATNVDLHQAVRDGRFREDLYYRLNVIPIRLPPLRERREDIPLLVEHFIEAARTRLNRGGIREVAAGALDSMVAYDWPGNVRELRNAVERAMVMSQGSVLRLSGPLGGGTLHTESKEASVATGALPLVVAAGSDQSAVSAPDNGIGSAPMKELLRRHKKQLVEAALAASDGNQARAAELLGVHRSNLNRTIKELEIRVR